MGKRGNLRLLSLKVNQWSSFHENSNCHKSFCPEDLETKLRMVKKFRFSFFFSPGNSNRSRHVISAWENKGGKKKQNVVKGS